METNYRNEKRRSYSWLSIIVGLISIIVGVWCVFTPISTLAALTILFIAGFFAAGFFELAFAFTNAGSSGWGWRLVAGIIDILLAIWLCAMPGAEAATVLVYVVGFYIFFYSVMGIAESISLKGLGYRSWGWLLFFNIVGVICSFLFLLGPAFGGLFIAWLAGASFISYGIYRCLLPAI